MSEIPECRIREGKGPRVYCHRFDEEIPIRFCDRCGAAQP